MYFSQLSNRYLKFSSESGLIKRSATNTHWWWVNTGSGNGLVPSDTKPLPEPMMTQIFVTIWHHYATSYKPIRQLFGAASIPLFLACILCLYMVRQGQPQSAVLCLQFPLQRPWPLPIHVNAHRGQQQKCLTSTERRPFRRVRKHNWWFMGFLLHQRQPTFKQFNALRPGKACHVCKEAGSALVQEMAWCLLDTQPLLELMLTLLSITLSVTNFSEIWIKNKRFISY